ncbi:hypothetical protein [Flavobacterium sp.]|uniref:hypothetical protein n=1 Tax=Flavobacterium sp. TaxID=239 RepID=UPI003A8F3BC8
MDLNKLTKLVGTPIIINRIQVYTDNACAVECIQGILKEIKAHSISIEQCFTDQDYIESAIPHTTREFINNEFDLVAPII